jgi:hypothetical protein
MLKGNLSTRPFYNERLATVAIAAVAVGVLLLTAYNAAELVALSSARRELRAEVARNQAEAAGIRAAAAAEERTVDRVTLSHLATSASEANDLIDQRTFSWTAFLGLIEKTLPLDVRLVVVSPRVERGVFKVSMTVVARDLTDVSSFVDALIESGRFYDAAPLEQRRRDDGAFNAIVEASYVSPASRTAPDPAPAGADGPARPPR